MRKTARKRILAIVLALCMMVTLMPSALAASAKDFTDVSPKAWYYDSVDYVAEHGYFNGTDVGKFSPNASMTRGMFVTVLARVDGAEVTDGVSPFEDVPAGMWYAGEVAWAAEQGIVLGVGNNRFAPERPVSRQEMAALIARYLAYYMKKHNVTFQAVGTGPVFQDADKIDAYAKEAVELCRSYGLVNGDEKGCFNPKALAARAEAAAVIQRLALLLATGEENPSGGGGGGGSTSETNSAGTAAGFIDAAQKHADTVTAAVEAENSITVNDDISITNDSVRTLTLDLNNASVGNLTVNSKSAIRIDLKGAAASVSSLTVNAPGATVTNGVTVNGSVEIQAVSGSTFNNTGDIKGNITVTGPAAVNDTQENPVPVVIATTKRVIVRGKSGTITIQEDGANLTLGTDAEVEPTVSSTAENVALSVATKGKTTISGTVDKLTATADQPKLNIEGTVGTLDATSADTLALTGGGSVDTLTAKNTEVEIPEESTALSVASAELTGGSLKAPDGAVDTVKAGGTVALNASVNKAETQPGATLNLTGNKTINTLTANGSLTLKNTGTDSAAVGQIDVAANSSSQITVPENVAVSAVNNTGSGSVAVTGEGAKDLTVTEKAAAPATVGFTAPTSAGGQGTITGVDSTMEYRASGGWTAITGESVSVVAGTYQVRVKATDTKLASEAVSVTIPAAVAVSTAAIQGSPYVGQTLTAVANADATGTLSYVWKAGTEPIAADKKFTLMDAQIGKQITVSISNYSGTDAVTSTATAAVTVDKTALNKLLDKAAEVQQGVAVKDKAAAEVAEGIVFVTPAESNALIGAATAAEAVAKRDDAKTADVTGQETALRKAIEAFTAAKKTGTLNEVSELQSELGTLITAANTARVSEENTDAANVAPNAPWVTAEVNAAYAKAITAADAAKDNSGATAAELAKAITDLNAAMLTYQKAVRKGAALDNTALLAAVNAAELNAASVSISTDGKNVLPSQSWVTQGEMDAYNTAITAAKSTNATVQNANATALAALNTATDTFNKKKKPGTKDIVPPIVTGVSAVKQNPGDTYTISFTSNEAGSYSYQVGSTEGTWTAGASFDEAGKTKVSFDYTPTTPGAMLFIQVSDESGNASVVQVKVGEEPVNAEASIGSAKYATFEQALTAATSGQTVKLLNNMDTGEREFVISGKNITLDLNGCTINSTITGKKKKLLTVGEGASLTIVDSIGGGTLYEKSVYDAPVLLNKGTLTIKAGTFKSEYTTDKGYNNFSLVMATNSTTVIEGGTFAGDLYSNGTDASVNITINGGNFEGFLYLAAKTGVIDITDGTFCAGFEVKGSKVDISGGTFKADPNADIETDHIPSNNGSSTGGAWAFVVVDNKAYGKAEATISGGTFTGPVALLDDDNVTDNNDDVLLITGGTFSEDPGAYVAEGSKATETGETWTVALKTEPDENDVASVGGRYYGTLMSAVEAAQSGDTIALLQDATLTDTVTVPSGFEITLDLNGSTLTLSGAGARRIQNYGTLTVNATNGGTLKNNTVGDGMTDSTGSYGLIDNYGTLTINGGTYTDVGNGNGASLKNRQGGIMTVNAGTFSATGETKFGNGCLHSEGKLTIADGVTFENKSFYNGGIYCVTVNNGTAELGNITVTGTKGGLGINSGTATINGGTYNGGKYYGVWITNDGENTHVTIQDGNFTGAMYGLKAGVDDGKQDTSNACILIQGGTFTGGTEAAVALNDSNSIMDWGMTITGGTFSTDPSAYVAKDYKATKGGDGKWTVEAGSAA